jgi:hypothetical protein
MGVIDKQNQRTALRSLDHGPAVAPQQFSLVLPGKPVSGRVRWQKRRQRPERQPPRCMGGGRAGY